VNATPDSGILTGKENDMPRKLPILAAKPHLEELVEGMTPGEQLVLTKDGEAVAVVTRPPRTSWPCQPGSAKDRSFWMAPDFNAPLEDFAEYME
jgi:antitoxin (DNA-binding transcriptional repressor) of toxin-antitoxin stability system